jgi:hypothetical protein
MALRSVLASLFLAQVQAKITWNATEMNEWLALAPACTKATDGDMRDHLRLTSAMRDLCTTHIGCGDHLDDVRVNPDDHTQACITQGQVHFTGLSPTHGSKQVDEQEACNNLDSKITQTINLGGSDGSSVTVSTSSTASFSEGIDIEVDIPEELKVTAKTTFGFSSSRTDSQKDTSSRSFSNSIQADIPPHSCVCGKEEVSTMVYDSAFTVDVCVTGAFRCQYSSTCNGHYYWYIPLSNLGAEKTCYTVNGHARSNQDISGHGVVNPGKCPSDALIV